MKEHKLERRRFRNRLKAIKLTNAWKAIVVVLIAGTVIAVPFVISRSHRNNQVVQPSSTNSIKTTPLSKNSNHLNNQPSTSLNQRIDTITVTKCFTNASATRGGEMLIKSSSSDTSAVLTAYRPNGMLIGQVQNGGGSRYGGTVMPDQPNDPTYVTIKSSSGGIITVPTTPFQL